MFKRLLVIITLFFSAGLYASESDSIADKMDFNFSNTPSEHGDKTFCYFRWFYDKNISTGIYYIYEKRKMDSTLSGRTDSLLVSDSHDKIFDFFPLEYTGGKGKKFEMRGGVGLNITKNELEEKGYFVTSPANPFHPSIAETTTRNHIYKNTSDTTFYTGKVQLEFFIRGFDGFFNVNNRSECIPYYYLENSQEINITPLVSNGPVSNNYRGGSTPYLMNELKVHLLKLFEFQYQLEYQKLKFEQITINWDGANWIFEVENENKYTIFNYSLLLNFRPVIFEDVDFVIGFGKRWLNTKNDTTGEKLVNENERIYNIGVASNKL